MNRRRFSLGAASAAAALPLLGLNACSSSSPSIIPAPKGSHVGNIFAAYLDTVTTFPDATVFDLLKKTAASPSVTPAQIEVAWQMLGSYMGMPDVPQPIPPAAPLTFPADHGEHFDTLIEWRYFTLSLPLPNGGLVSVIANFFRKALVTEKLLPTAAALSRQLYSTSIGVTIEMPGQPGVHFAWPNTTFAAADGTVFVENAPFTMVLGKNSISGGNDVFPLHIHLEDAGDAAVGRPSFVVDVDCQATNPLFLQGLNGYVGVGGNPGWYYYSWPQQNTSGQVVIGGTKYAVTDGLCWMDHQWGGSTAATSGSPYSWSGWSWFEFQFDGDRSFTGANTHGPIAGGTLPPNLPGFGTFVDNGTSTLMASSLNVGSYVQSPNTTARYPASWTLTAGNGSIDLAIQPVVKTEPQALWMGVLTEYSEANAVVTASGTINGVPVQLSGVGYCESVGFEDPVAANARAVAYLQSKL